jgi:hypothetical protein
MVRGALPIAGPRLSRAAGRPAAGNVADRVPGGAGAKK